MSGVYVDVALPLALPAPLTYAVPDELAALAVPGARVVVPAQQREMVGIVTAAGREAPKAAVRQVIAARRKCLDGSVRGAPCDTRQLDSDVAALRQASLQPLGSYCSSLQ